jgi:adenylate kinase
MLRAAAKAGTVVGLRAKEMMDRGELVPDDVVVSIVADRIAEPDAKNGFILDGFPRTVPQAVALDKMLKEKGLTLDGVIELRVDGAILQSRIENRIREATARGEPLRADDDPEVLKRRVDAYREQTAPLVDYYRWQGTLKSVDGMQSIDEVEAAVHRALGQSPAEDEEISPEESAPSEDSASSAERAEPSAKVVRNARKSSRASARRPAGARAKTRAAKTRAAKTRPRKAAAAAKAKTKTRAGSAKSAKKAVAKRKAKLPARRASAKSARGGRKAAARKSNR